MFSWARDSQVCFSASASRVVSRAETLPTSWTFSFWRAWFSASRCGTRWTSASSLSLARRASCKCCAVSACRLSWALSRARRRSHMIGSPRSTPKANTAQRARYRLAIMNLTLLIDQSGEIPGPEPVVDLHHRHPGGAGVEHGGQKCPALENGALDDVGVQLDLDVPHVIIAVFRLEFPEMPPFRECFLSESLRKS